MKDLPRPLPSRGAIFLDARGGDRAMRVSWHQEAGLVVLSLWRGNVCAGSFRLGVEEVPTLIRLLREGLDTAYQVARTRTADLPGPANRLGAADLRAPTA